MTNLEVTTTFARPHWEYIIWLAVMCFTLLVMPFGFLCGTLGWAAMLNGTEVNGQPLPVAILFVLGILGTTGYGLVVLAVQVFLIEMEVPSYKWFN